MTGAIARSGSRANFPTGQALRKSDPGSREGRELAVTRPCIPQNKPCSDSGARKREMESCMVDGTPAAPHRCCTPIREGTRTVQSRRAGENEQQSGSTQSKHEAAHDGSNSKSTRVGVNAAHHTERPIFARGRGEPREDSGSKLHEYATKKVSAQHFSFLEGSTWRPTPPCSGDSTASK